MKRTLASVVGIGFVLILLLCPMTPAFAQNAAGSKQQTLAKADTSENSIATMDAVVKTDSAGKLQPVVKLATPKAEMPDSILPPPDGNELSDSCKAQTEGFDAGYCLGVVEGVIASMRLCKRDHSVITLGEAADATVKYMGRHPEKLKERDVLVARKALSEAYPCGGSRR